MIRILQVVSVMDAGGMENYIMNMYRLINRDEIQFDFLVHHKRKGFFEDEITKLGGKIYHCSFLDDKNLLKYIGDLKKIYKENRYKVVHGHLSSLAFIYLGVAKMCGIPYRIAHSHGAGHLNSLKGYAKYAMFKGAKVFSNVYYACSSEAGKYLFGKDEFKFIPNGISVERFNFDEKQREQIRKEYDLEDSYVVGHVGRFNLQKNHSFILEMFKELIQQIPNAKLLLLGDGELREEIVDTVKKLELEKYVIFAGVRKDCERFYCAMDVFILPSLFEGLPVTGIEAQYSGLHCIFSNKISKEVKISNKVSFLGIGKDDVEKWVEEIVKVKNVCDNRKVEIERDDYDVSVTVKAMQEEYNFMGGK